MSVVGCGGWVSERLEGCGSSERGGGDVDATSSSVVVRRRGSRGFGCSFGRFEHRGECVVLRCLEVFGFVDDATLVFRL